MQRSIAHQRIRPSSPQETGAHERMHRTLKRQAIKPAQATCGARQRNVDAFRREYNDERPYESLGQTTRTSHYTASRRRYPARPPVLRYPGHFLVKWITAGWTLKFGKRWPQLANALTTQQIGLDETDDSLSPIYFHSVCWPRSTNATTSFRADRCVNDVAGPKCYPSSGSISAARPQPAPPGSRRISGIGSSPPR